MTKLNFLHLALNSEYFDAIVSGDKTKEYRLATPYWVKRLEGRTYNAVEISKGYPKKNDTSRRDRREWLGVERQTITHKHFGPDPVEVFAIDVSTPLGQCPNYHLRDGDVCGWVEGDT